MAVYNLNAAMHVHCKLAICFLATTGYATTVTPTTSIISTSDDTIAIITSAISISSVITSRMYTSILVHIHQLNNGYLGNNTVQYHLKFHIMIKFKNLKRE